MQVKLAPAVAELVLEDGYAPLFLSKESEWKLFRELHRVALDRFCQRFLGGMTQIGSDASEIAYDR